MEIIYRDNKLTIGNNSLELRNPIKKIEEFNDMLVVLLERELNTDFYENVLAFDFDLGLVWQIEKFPEFVFNGKTYVGINKPYVDIVKLSEIELVLFNYDGTKLKVNPTNGELLENPVEGRLGRRPW